MSGIPKVTAMRSHRVVHWPSTFAQAAKIRRTAAAKEHELAKNHEKLMKELKSSYDTHSKALMVIKILTYFLLIIWFWSIPVASIPKQLFQPFGKILSWRAGGPANENVMVGYILQEIAFLVQQMSDLFLLFPMDYSSVATGAEDNKYGEEEYFKIDDPNANSLPPKSWSKPSTLITFLECYACKCQDCKAKHNGVINAINALTAFVKEMTSKKGVVPSKRTSYPYTPLEIKVDVTVEATAEEHNITIDNLSTASKEEEKIKPISSGEQKNYPF
ncbi:putative G-rich sequence factor 1-like [Capsicum annuum]|nr:putative G-rich sequence factor 1-like [Capsicum annuum]